MDCQIPLESLLQMLQQIPGLHVSYDDTFSSMHKMFSSNTTFEEWTRHWLKVHEMGLAKDNTYDLSYRNPVEQYLIPYFGKHSLVAISPGDI